MFVTYYQPAPPPRALPDEIGPSLLAWSHLELGSLPTDQGGKITARGATEPNRSAAQLARATMRLTSRFVTGRPGSSNPGVFAFRGRAAPTFGLVPFLCRGKADIGMALGDIVQFPRILGHEHRRAVPVLGDGAALFLDEGLEL